MRRLALSALFLILPLTAACQSVEPDQAAATITPEDFHQRIGVMAHDSMRGRNTPSPELEMVAEWAGREFQAMGLQPGGDDGSYLQRYSILQVGIDAEASALTVGSTTLAFGQDVYTEGAFATTAEGPISVLAGSEAIEAALEGTELAGRFVVILAPPGVQRSRDPALRQTVGMVQAQRAAVLVLVSAASAAEWAAASADALERTSTVVGQPASGGGGTAAVWVREGAIAPVLAAAGIDLGAMRRQAGGTARLLSVPGEMTATLDQQVAVVQEESAPNVVAILPGSDAELADEYVVFSAHMDHVGVRGAVDGDSIYNGADDDASGSAMVLEVAQAMAALRPAPRRSTVFLLVSGEERGLWGSRYFADNPTVPADGLVANINTDMVGRNWTDTIVAIGKEHSDLGATLETVNAAHPELGMTAIDDLWPEQNFYRRSDHFSFARKGVPILFFFNGTHADYHRPSDELELIDTEKTARIGRLVFYLGLEVASRDERPEWDPESYREIVGGGG